MLYMANIMQYEDDFDDTAIFAGNRKRRKGGQEDSSSEEEAKTKKGVPKILTKDKQGTPQRAPQEEDEDEDDDVVDVAEKFIEQENAEDANTDYLFQDDPKHERKVQQEKLRQER